MTIKELAHKVEKYNPKADLDMINLAYSFAEEAHRGQKRMSGEDYIQHPLHVAVKLADLRLDTPTIIAGLLHDVPEDTEKTIEDVKTNFGKEVAFLVEGITKLGKIKYRGVNRFAESLRKMFVAMASDIRVIFIKFADRMHNLETLYALSEVKQQRIAKEALEIYAPIASRLGMGKLHGELQDKAFPYAYPEEYKWIRSLAAEEKQIQKKRVDITIKKTEGILKENDIADYEIHGRVKHNYSLYTKLMKPKYNKDLANIYDLVAIRIVVNRLRDCYFTLGLIHQAWKPIPEQIKDYIAQPKLNGYQSIHTVVFTKNGHPIEFQIRTKEMHELAEYGVAAHFHYTEASKTGTKKMSKENKKWLEQLKKIQKEIQDSTSFIETLKLDIFSKRIFIFTPNGDVIDLPEGANAIDFAYHIHTEVGNHCGGAKINGKLTDLTQALKSGDMVEIILDKKRAGPSEDWLDKVKTVTAKDKIRSSIKKQQQSFIARMLNRD